MYYKTNVDVMLKFLKEEDSAWLWELKKFILLLMMISIFTFSFADNWEIRSKNDNNEIAEYFWSVYPWEPLNRRIYYFNYTLINIFYQW